MTGDRNYIHVRSCPRDIISLFCGHDEGDPLEPIAWFDDGWTLAHVMKDAGIFPSVSQARKAGWDRDVEIGFREYTVGKRRLKVYTLKSLPRIDMEWWEDIWPSSSVYWRRGAVAAWGDA